MQLRNLAKLSALVAGFAMASFLQFNFDISTVQNGVLTAYALVTALVVRWQISSLERHMRDCAATMLVSRSYLTSSACLITDRGPHTADPDAHSSTLHTDRPLLQAALNLTALNICTLLLASTLKVAENSLSVHEESLFMLQCRQFALEYAPCCQHPSCFHLLCPPRQAKSCRMQWTGCSTADACTAAHRLHCSEVSADKSRA